MAPTLQTLYGTTEHHGRYGVLIHDSYPDVRLFQALLRGDFPPQWLLTAAVASGVTIRCAGPGRGESVTELTPFRNFLLHSYTCCSDRHASPYWTSIRRWIPMGFTPSLRKKRMTERCSSLVHVASGAAIFTLLLRRRVAFLHRTVTCRPLFKARVSPFFFFYVASGASPEPDETTSIFIYLISVLILRKTFLSFTPSDWSVQLSRIPLTMCPSRPFNILCFYHSNISNEEYQLLNPSILNTVQGWNNVTMQRYIDR